MPKHINTILNPFLRSLQERRRIIDVEYEDISNIEDDNSEEIEEIEDESVNLD